MADQDSYSDVQQEVPASADTEKDPSSVARGLKASLHNPKVSDEGKQRVREKLDNLGEPYANEGGASASGEKDPSNVARGLKAAISNPGVSDEAKESAKQRLSEIQGGG